MAIIEICLASDNAADLNQEVSKIYCAGAARIELCSAMAEHGLTPNTAAIAIARTAFRERNGLNVMIRPRAGGFHYNNKEIALMKTQIKVAADLGADGVIFGALAENCQAFDQQTMETLIQHAKKYQLEVGIHRAFDAIADPYSALIQLQQWQVERVLTAGQPWGSRKTAQEGISTIIDTLVTVDGDIEIVIGGGVNQSNAIDMIATLSQLDADKSKFRYSFHAYSGVLSHGEVCEQRVKKLVAIAS